MINVLNVDSSTKMMNVMIAAFETSLCSDENVIEIVDRRKCECKRKKD